MKLFVLYRPFFVGILTTFCLFAISYVYASGDFSQRPPIPQFLFEDTQYANSAGQQYGLGCPNTLIPSQGVLSAVYAASKTAKELTLEGYTPNNATVTVKCDIAHGYYDLLTSASSFTMTCINGRFENTSSCVRKCKFSSSEFNKNADIIIGRDVSEFSNSKQWKTIPFEYALIPNTNVPVQNYGSIYYVKVGDSVKITCGDGYAPYSSDVTVMKNSNGKDFVTKCLDSTTPTQNEWSVKMSCYNGFKSCDNTKVKIYEENHQCNTYGQCFYVKGGSIAVPTGQTPHGGRLFLDCNQPWYNTDLYTSPRCIDGDWTSNIAYCNAIPCTYSHFASFPDTKKDRKVGNIRNGSDVVLYHGQIYEFQCNYHNRNGATSGKQFLCSIENNIATAKDYDTSTARFCLSDKVCRLGDSYNNGKGLASWSYVQDGESYDYIKSELGDSCHAAICTTFSDTYFKCKRAIVKFQCTGTSFTETQTLVDWTEICPEFMIGSGARSTMYWNYMVPACRDFGGINAVHLVDQDAYDYNMYDFEKTPNSYSVTPFYNKPKHAYCDSSCYMAW